jgi:hypothetical protein
MKFSLRSFKSVEDKDFAAPRWRLILGLIGLGLGLTACASSPKPESETGSVYQKKTYGDAVSAPLEDLNLRRRPIPTVLLRAVEDPYNLTKLERCEQIAAEVGKLDTALGKDYDEPPPPKDQRTIGQKGSDMADNAAKDAVKDAARSLIPMRGLIRSVSGADAHEKRVNAAIQAGKVRRAYLKGIGMNKNCSPPAAPSWFKPKIYVEPNIKPKTKRRTSRSSN